MALRLVAEGLSRRKIGRVMRVSPQSVSTWHEDYVASLPEPVKPSSSEVTELDELYTFVESKKQVLPHHSGRPSNALLHELGADHRTHR